MKRFFIEVCFNLVLYVLLNRLGANLGEILFVTFANTFGWYLVLDLIEEKRI